MDLRTFRVLHLEDNPADIRYFEEIAKDLRDIKLEIISAATLARGVELLESSDFDLAVCDLGLPDSMGLYTVKQVISGFPDLPVIVMTSINDEQLGVKAIRMGAQDYLPKGNFDSGLLSRAIKYSIERNDCVVSLRTKDKAKFLALMEIFPGGAAFFDQELVIKECNSQFVSRVLQDAGGPVNLEKIADSGLLDCARAALSGEEKSFDCSGHGINQSSFSGILRFMPVKDSSGTVHGVLCVTVDNTEAKPESRPFIDLYSE